jgi:sensor histidine kinase YesM
MRLKLSRSFYFHLLGWALLLTLLFFQVYTDAENEKDVISIIRDLIGYFWVLISATYVNLFLWSYYYRRNQVWIYLILSPIIFIFSILFIQANNFLLKDFIAYTSLFKSGVNVLLFFLITIGIDYLREGIKNEKLIQELQLKTNEMELNSLKHQLNPHFFFNSLNNIYGTIKSDPKIGAEMILSLSDVLRYHLQSVHKTQVSLIHEWNIILEYIKIELLRLSSTENLKLKTNITNQSATIPPLVLFPLIENAFKHGASSNSVWFINIDLEVDHRHIQLIIENSVINKNVIKTNIGINNLLRRLSIIYGDKFHFFTKRSSSTYLTHLEITL